MPRTRSTEAHEDKAEQIVAAAERQLREGASLSLAAVARELGVAQNTVYWYFPSRDHLFVAALQRVFTDLVRSKRAQQLETTDAIVWFVDRLAEVAELRAAMFERARHSPVVAEFAEGLQEGLHTMLGNALGPHVEPGRLDDTVRTFVATVEGLLVQDVAAEDRRRLVRVALEALTGGGLSGPKGR